MTRLLDDGILFEGINKKKYRRTSARASCFPFQKVVDLFRYINRSISLCLSCCCCVLSTAGHFQMSRRAHSENFRPCSWNICSIAARQGGSTRSSFISLSKLYNIHWLKESNFYFFFFFFKKTEGMLATNKSPSK